MRKSSYPNISLNNRAGALQFEVLTRCFGLLQGESVFKHNSLITGYTSISSFEKCSVSVRMPKHVAKTNKDPIRRQLLPTYAKAQLSII